MSPPTSAKSPLERSTLRGTGPEAEVVQAAPQVHAVPAEATAPNELAAIDARAAPNEEVRAALEALKADLPPDATGPFLRRVGHLRALREPEPSDRKEHLDRAGVHTHPVGVAPAPRVIVSPRPLRGEHVTSPSLRKQHELGLDADFVGTGRAPGGQTLRLTSGAPDDGLDPNAISEPSPSARSPLARWAFVVVLLLGLVGGLVIWLVRAVRKDERQRIDGATSAAVSAPPVETTRVEPSVPSATAVSSASAQLVAPVSATAARSESPSTSANRPPSSPPTTATATTSSRPPDKPSSSPSAPLPPLPNTTAPTATSGLPND